jgi:hypothetical protein
VLGNPKLHGISSNFSFRQIANAANRCHFESVFAVAKFLDPVAPGPHQITCSHR